MSDEKPKTNEEQEEQEELGDPIAALDEMIASKGDAIQRVSEDHFKVKLSRPVDYGRSMVLEVDVRGPYTMAHREAADKGDDGSVTSNMHMAAVFIGQPIHFVRKIWPIDFSMIDMCMLRIIKNV